MKTNLFLLLCVCFIGGVAVPTGQAADAVIGLLDSPEKAAAAQAAWAGKLGKPVQWTNSVGMTFQLIPPGEFDMGTKNGDKDAPPHHVRLTQPFYLGTFEVTREQWEKVKKHQHSNYFPGPRQPMNYVNWYDAESFLKSLSQLEAITNAVARYRLPTEAEWEYAARAGTTTRYYTGDTEADLARAGWYEKNSDGTAHPVGQKAPNAFGLYDMLGNLWEWCSDCYDAAYYPNSPAENPPGQKCEYPYEYNVLRGGACLFGASFCTAWHRDHTEAERTFKDVGVRVVLPIR